MSRGHFIGLNHHRLMLADAERMARYHAAIVAQVEPGMRVMDLGTGTGILALWAAQAGAEVVAVEPHDVISVAKAIAERNGLADRITFIQGDSRELQLERPVDLVITECMGNFFVTDEMQPVLRDLPRHMSDGGVTLPRRISLHLAAATLPLWRELAFWDEPVGGFDFGPARVFADQAAYVLACEPEFVSAGPTELQAFPLVEAPDALTMTSEMEVTRAVTLHALIGWFDADLGEGITLSTRPGIRTHWGQMAFPLPATSVRSGDRITVQLCLAMDAELRCHYTWSGRIIRSGHPEGDVSFARDTRKRFGAVLEADKQS
jgi:SAM-dependent methyltransferase